TMPSRRMRENGALKDMQQSIGAPFSRILREGIVPMLEATLQIMAEIGITEAPEDGIFRLNAGRVELRFTSPLVQSQATLEVERFVQAVAVITQIAGPEQGPQLVALTTKIEDVPKWVYERMQVDPGIQRTKQEIDQLQQQAAQAAAAQQGAPVAGQEAA